MGTRSRIAPVAFAAIFSSPFVIGAGERGSQMDRLEAMTTLLATIEGGTLTAASRRLNTPLPTISRRISELESHLGAKLFIRSSRKLVLTEAGDAYAAACRRILADVSEAERTVGNECVTPTGALTLCAPTGLGRAYLVPILTK